MLLDQSDLSAERYIDESRQRMKMAVIVHHSTVLSGLDSMPPTFLMYRQFLQWVGGLGIVIFVVAI